MAFRDVDGLSEVLCASLMEVDLGVEFGFGAWDQTITYGEWYDGSVVPVSKERLAVGALGDDMVAVRIDPLWRRLYFGFGSERHEWYRPSFVPEVSDEVDEDLNDEDLPPVDGGDVEDDQSWGEEFPPAEEPAEEEESDTPELYGTTLKLQHYVQSSEMGREIVFAWADQGAVHVMTSKSGRYTAMVTVFKKEWMPGPGFSGMWMPNYDPENYEAITPGRYKVRFPLPVQLLDFAWDAYRQKVVWTRRDPRTFMVTVVESEEEFEEEWYEMTVGEFQPPAEDAMRHYPMMDGLFWDSWAKGLTPKATNEWNTFSKPQLQVLLGLDSTQSSDVQVNVVDGLRYWVYDDNDGGFGWKHREQAYWNVFENTGS